jgi:hypothetical protein
VAHEDLLTLERERLARDDNLDFNNYASFKRAWTGQDAVVPETKATYYGSLAQGTRCNNCPSRGCAACPMFGVGQNPIYLKRQKVREAKKVKSGQAAREVAEREAQRRIGILFGESGVDLGSGEARSPLDDDNVFVAIFGEGCVSWSQTTGGVSWSQTAGSVSWSQTAGGVS